MENLVVSHIKGNCLILVALPMTGKLMTIETTIDIRSTIRQMISKIRKHFVLRVGRILADDVL